MSNPVLWLQSGLYLQKLCQVKTPPDLAKKIAKAKASMPRSKNKSNHVLDQLDKLEQEFVDYVNTTPIAQLPREPRTRTIYISVRESESYPAECVVDRVFESPADGRIALTQRVLSSGQVTFECAGYDVKLLPAFENLDILVRAGKFMAAAINVLSLVVPAAESQNLNPVYDLLRWWDDPKLHIPATCNWHGIEDWIKQEFLDRERRFYDNLKADKLVIDLPVCFSDLVREINFDQELTTALLNATRAQHQAIGPDLTDRALIEPSLARCANSAFRNSGKWAAACLAENPLAPKWFGFAYLQAKKLAERELLEQSGRPRTPQLPVKEGRELLIALKPPAAIVTVEGAVVVYLATKTRDHAKKCKNYFAAKATYATAKYYLTRQSLSKLIGTSQTPEQRQKAGMALLRAIDRWVWDSPRSARKVAKKRAGEFVRLAHNVTDAHLSLPDDEWPHKHIYDQKIFEQLVLHGPGGATTTGALATPSQTMKQVENETLAHLIKKETLDHLIQDAELSDKECPAILYEYRVVSERPDVSDDELERLQRSALRKLRTAASRLRISEDDDE